MLHVRFHNTRLVTPHCCQRPEHEINNTRIKRTRKQLLVPSLSPVHGSDMKWQVWNSRTRLITSVIWSEEDLPQLHDRQDERTLSTRACGFTDVPVDVCLLVACLTSQEHASVSQARICSDNCTCCHTEIEVADQIFYLTQSQSILTPGGPVSALTLQRQAPGRVATGVPILKSLV